MPKIVRYFNPSTPLLLDLFPSADYAYSFRKLRELYTGNCIRVRRASDNAETDIGFSGKYLDLTALATFIGSSDAFITTIYDQSGNGRDMLQTTAIAQLYIAVAGVILTKNSKVSAYHTNTRNMICIPSPVISTIDRSEWVVASADTTTTSIFHNLSTTSGTTYEGLGFSGALGKIIAPFRNTTDYNIQGSNTVANQLEMISYHNFSTTSRFLYVNSVNSFSSATLTAGFNANRILLNRLRITDVISGFGYFTERVAWDNNQNTNRLLIDANIKNYYGTP